MKKLLRCHDDFLGHRTNNYKIRYPGRLSSYQDNLASDKKTLGLKSLLYKINKEDNKKTGSKNTDEDG